MKYRNGEAHYLWGKEYTLQLIKNDTVKHVLIDADKSMMYLPVPKRSTIQKREKTLLSIMISKRKLHAKEKIFSIY